MVLENSQPDCIPSTLQSSFSGLFATGSKRADTLKASKKCSLKKGIVPKEDQIKLKNYRIKSIIENIYADKIH